MQRFASRRTVGTRLLHASLLARLVFAALAIAPLAGCGDGSGPTGSGSRLVLGGTDSGSNSAASALVGRWYHLVYLPDSSGTVRTSETTLDLRGDGTVVRTVVARLLSFDFADEVVSSGTWSADGSVLTITITSVGSGAAPVDTTATGGAGTPPLTGNPPFGAVPPLTGTPIDTAGTSADATRYSYRIVATSEGRTLFLGETPFVELIASSP